MIQSLYLHIEQVNQKSQIFFKTLLKVNLLMKVTCKIGDLGAFVLKRTVPYVQQIILVNKIQLCSVHCVVLFQLNYICIPDA